MAQAPTFIVIAHYYFIYLLPESIYLLPCAAVNFPPLAFHLTHFLFLFVVAVFSFYLQVLILPRPINTSIWTIPRRSAGHITNSVRHNVLPDN